MRRAAPQGAPVEVEVCPKHGVWFDRGCLSLVARAAAKALGKPVPAAIDALDGAKARKPQADEAQATEPTAKRPPADPPPTSAEPSDWTSFGRETRAREGGSTPPAPAPSSRAADLAYDVADVGVGAAGVVVDAADTAVTIVAIPVELTLAAVSGLGSLFD